MKSKIIVGVFLIQSLFTMQSTAQTLDQHLWEDRLLLIFSPDDLDQKVNEQLAILDHDKVGLKDRRMVIYKITGENITSTKGFKGEKNASLDFQKKFNVPQSLFTVILIGLDGGEKLRQFEPLELDQLFGIIDQMPMRKYEIKKSKKN